MTLSLKPGTRVATADGDDLGTIRNVVVDPSRNEVTHVLVEKGVFFTDDRVVPTAVIDHVENESAVLRGGIDPATLPRFDRGDYTAGDDATGTRLGLAPSELYFWRFPVAAAAPFPIYPAHPMAEESSSGREDRTRLALTEGEIVGGRTPVVSIEGEKVGTVDEVVVDDDGRLSHMMVDLGFLNDRVVLPAHWIEAIDAAGVRLAVSDGALETLETIT